MKQWITSLTFGVLISLWLILGGCSKQRVVAQVGSVSIKQGQQELRLKMVQQLNPAMTSEMALNQLIHAAKLSQVLDSLGIITTEDEIDTKFESLKEQASKNDAIANLLKKFGGHKEFKTLYVKPLLEGEKIHFAGFSKDTAFQSSQTQPLEKILAETLSDPSTLEDLSSKYQTSLHKGKVDVKGAGLIWNSIRQVASPHSLPSGLGIARKWYHEFLKEAADGQMINRVESLGDFFVVIRKDHSLEKEPEVFQVTVAALRKKTFSDWINEKMAPIKVDRFPAS